MEEGYALAKQQTVPLKTRVADVGPVAGSVQRSVMEVEEAQINVVPSVLQILRRRINLLILQLQRRINLLTLRRVKVLSVLLAKRRSNVKPTNCLNF